MVVQPGATKLGCIEGKSERLDEVQLAARVRA